MKIISDIQRQQIKKRHNLIWSIIRDNKKKYKTRFMNNKNNKIVIKLIEGK